MSPEQGRVAAVRAGQEARLLGYPNVVGVGEGLRGGTPALLVFVTHKVPAAQLAPAELLPDEIDGVPIDVVPVGEVRAQAQPEDQP